MLRSLLILVASGLILCATSCGPSKAVSDLTKTTQETLELVKKEAQRAIAMTVEKVKNYEVDPDIGKEIIHNLKETEKKIDTQLAVAAEVEKSGNREAILKFAERTNVIIQSALTDLKSLNDLYDISTFSSFETATFFPAGGFGIPPEKQEEAKKSIEPIVQRIIKFFGDHPRQRFVAVIVCYGYSDETQIAKESPLYNPLLAKMKTNNPTRQELNVKLSELRAKSIANLLVDLIKTNEGLIPNPKLINYDIKWMGKGEELPYPDKIKDYKAEDKRRRMVSLIWNVLPGSLYAQGLSNDTAMR
jgi:outer membrane protein OmpA-like peptidoglycan-associated protein